MRPNYVKATLKTATLAAIGLLSLPGVSSAQTVKFTASRQSTTLPDGNMVPMWGWTCGAVTQATGATATTQTTCTSLSYVTSTGAVGTTPQPQSAVGTLSTTGFSAGGGAWQPPLIEVPYVGATTSLTINLTNALPVETSIIIIGQATAATGAANGGLGAPVREAAARADGDHQTQTSTTWTTVVPGTFVPPTQEARARSFVAEVAGVTNVGNTPAVGTYTWSNLQPGTYLIRTATYPSIQGPMGLYGVLVVTQAPGSSTSTPLGIAYPPASGALGTATGAVTYDADVVALESEIDARQNNMVAAVFPTACTGAGVPVTQCTAAGALPTGAATANTGFLETNKWIGACGAGPNGLTSAGTPATCYPPAVDYTPLYFLFNGVSFSKTNQQASALPIPPTAASGNVLIRYVNAGSHMHIPSINGLSELLVTEDAYVLSDVALRLAQAAPGNTLTAVPSANGVAPSGLNLRNEVWQAAGKVADVIVSPAATGTSYNSATYLIYDRSLSGLSTDNARDGGMQVVLDVNDSGAAKLVAASAATLPSVSAKTYACAPGVNLVVSDPGKGVIANDTNVYGVTLSGNPANNTVTAFGGRAADSLTLNPNGTFTYTQAATNTTCGGSFTYYANGNTSAATTATVTISQSATVGQRPTANPDSYASGVASLLRVGAPGVLVNDTDPNGYPLCAVAAAAASGSTLCPSGVQTIAGTNGATISLSSDGGFTATLATPPAAGTTVTSTFTYVAANSQGTPSTPATVTLTFPAGSGLNVVVQDANTHAAITDYKWIIEQDRTMQVNPACQQNGPGGTKPATCPAGTPLTVATNFHVSYMPVIAEGCTGPQSCEKGQTVYDPGTPCTTPPSTSNPAGIPAGCSVTGHQHVEAACDGYGICTIGAAQLPASGPSQAVLNAKNPDGSPATNYYLSILAGDAQNAFAYGNSQDPTVGATATTPLGTNCNPANFNPAGGLTTAGTEPSGITEASACSHTMSGVPVTLSCTGSGPTAVCTPPTQVTVNLEPAPLKTATVTAWVFEDDFPLNGEPDAGGGVDVLPTQEPGLGDFQIEIWDTAGGIGDNTGQMTYDMFNMPLTNALNGTIDPNSGLDACPIAPTATTASGAKVAAGTIIVCPTYESDGKTPSPLVGQVLVRNLMQGKFSLIIHPGEAREARGEEWVQTNSLDGGHFLDSFIKVGEPAYFQEYGPGGYHVFFAMANPKIINARLAAICAPNAIPNPLIPFAAPCNNTINGQVTNLHQPRSPSESLSSSGVFPQGDPRNYAMLAYTNCYISIGDSDGATIAFTKCDPNGNFTFSGLPDGNYGIVVFDQWDDFILDGSSHPASVHGGQTLNLQFPSFTWQTHLWNHVYMDTLGLGTPMLDTQGNLNPVFSPGLIQVPVRIRQVNGKLLNTLLSDVYGNVRFDETFPAFAWYSVESDNTRFRSTGVHVVNDAGGAPDGPTPAGNGNSGPYDAILNSQETFSVAANLRVPGAVYCGTNDAACLTTNLSTNPTGNTATAPVSGATSTLSTGRIDPGSNTVEGWQGGVGEFDIMDWGKTPYIAGETGGIRGHVVNATTRPFDDPRMLFQNLWEPLVPNVKINLYQEITAPDGTTTLTLVDTTMTTSFDSWAQGRGADGVTPNMSCPGQDPVNDPFFVYTLQNTQNYLYPTPALPNASQFKCYDGYHNLNQLQPMPYDGLFQFPSQTCLTPGATFTVPGNTTAYHCVTVANPAAGLAGAATAVMPPGKYVTEVILPPGWQLDKEEDLNLLIGDQYIAPVTQQFVGLANIFIVPDQAAMDAVNPSYTGPYTSGAPGNASSGAYVQPWSCPTPTTCTLTPSKTNNGKPSTDYGRTTLGSFGPGGLIVQSAPCVGKMRIVPDYLSIAPESGEIAPFAGALRALCDRKEITLDDQMQADVDFFIYTHTPKTTNFIGFVSDDFSSEFDPASPSFGEKFAVTNVPVSIRDFNGAEVSRVYTDQFGTFNGLVYSTWEVDPPNITGYSPNMMITCMNDPGPIPGPNGTLITDPNYNPAYSIFCYENPFMPGDTQYLDVPVVPVSAFADGYNPPDCAYPDTTPAVASVTGDTIGGVAGQAGPWVNNSGSLLTINALAPAAGPGFPVLNNAYSGPAASTAPYNLKTINRHYSFGTQCTAPQAGSPTCSTASSVTIGGVPAVINSWTDATIVVTVPPIPAANSSCPIQQKNVPAGTNAAACGELVITAGNGKQSIDTVTVTVGGEAPTYVTPTSVNGATTYGGQTVSSYNAIQLALDNANPGDLVIVGPGIYNEMLLMWKPVRLQGVGAASVQVNANVSPNGTLLEPWRRQVNCLFGLALNGGSLTSFTVTDPDTGITTTHPGVPYDPSGQYTCPASMQGIVQRIPLEATIGWDAALNGNLAELLQEPTLMGAYEGAGITVLGQGLVIPPGTNPAEAAFPAGTRLLTDGVNPNGFGTGNLVAAVPADCGSTNGVPNYPGNFLCNPSRVDGLSFINSSQGGGGIWLHAWNHYMEVSNNRIYNNGGTLSGGITIGQPEVPDVAAGNTPTTTDTAAVTGSAILVTNADGTIDETPYLYVQHVNVHNNSITLNASYGDELGSNTPASAGATTFCSGADYYKYNYNWVCGNLSSGNGGGLAQFGFNYNGDIEHNSFMFNQSVNPTLTTYGGGAIIQGIGPDGFTNVGGVATECGSTTDIDCPPGLSDGIGPGLVINANLFQGNTAEEGSGGGIEFQHTNGNDVARNPSRSDHWFGVTVTNNVFANNVAGWDGGGVSLHDAVKIDFRNNTVISNDSTASAGILFDTLLAPSANQPPPGCNPNLPNSATNNCTNTAVTTSVKQPAGLATEAHTATFLAAFRVQTVNCGDGGDGDGTSYGTTGTSATSPSQCAKFSVPLLHNNIFWQNRAFNITTPPLSPTSNSAGPVQLTPALTQSVTGGPPTGGTPSYWDIGVYGDTGAANHASGLTLNPHYSILDDPGDYPGANNVIGVNNGTVVAQYFNGSRVPPEIATQLCLVPNGQANAPGCIQPGTLGLSLTVPGGVPDSVPPPLPAFTLTPAATVDEGSNWINMFYGPLSTVNPTVLSTAAGYGTPLQNSAPGAASPALGAVPAAVHHPATDFFGNPRPDPGDTSHFDIGAIELQSAGPANSLSSINPSSGGLGAAVNVTLTGTNLTGATSVNPSAASVTVSNFHAVNATTVTATLNIASGTTPGPITVSVTAPSGTTNNVTFTVTSGTPQFTGPVPALNTGPTTGTKMGTITFRNAASTTSPTAGALTLTAAPTVTRTAGVGTFTIVTTGPNASTCVATSVIQPGQSCTIVVQDVTTSAATSAARVAVTDTGASTAAQTLTFPAN
jgi:hypothetical protein